MYFASLFIVTCVCLCSAYGSGSSGNILTDPRKSDKFLQAFMKNVVETGSFPFQQANINGIIQSLNTAISEAQAKAASSAFSSVMSDLIAIGGDKSLVNGRKNTIQWALEKSYKQLGEQVDRQLLQEIRNGINVFIEKSKNGGYKTDLGVGFNADDGIDIELGLQDKKNIGIGVEDQKNGALALGTNVGVAFGVDADFDEAVDFKLRLLTVLKAANIFDGYSGAVNKNQLNLVSRLLVQLLSSRFNLQLESSYIASCYQALAVLDVSLGFEAYLTVLAEFTSQLLVQKGQLTDVDAALRNSCESIILACSEAFNLSIDIGVTLDTALSVDIGVGIDPIIGFGHGEEVTAGIDNDVLVQIAKKFEIILKSSEKLNLAVLSGIRQAVLFASIPVVRDSLGSKAAEALARCAGAG